MTTSNEESPPGPGHNSAGTEADCGLLRTIIERVEEVEEDRRAQAENVKDIYREAKGKGLDVTTIRTIVRLRRMDQNDRAEREAILDAYLRALGER